jgi:hypothetical protein
MQDLSLSTIDEILLAIEAATTAQEIKEHIDIAKAAEVYAKQAKAGIDMELRASEYIVRAERKLGKVLQDAKAAGQIGRGGAFNKVNVPEENIHTFTLEEAGISRKLSSLAQKIAAIPEHDFEKTLTELKEAGKLSPKAVLRSTRADGQKPKKVPKARDKDEPEISQGDLSLTAQQKLDLAIRQHKNKLNAEFHEAVNFRVQEFLENTILPKLQEEQAEARRIMEARKGIMNRKAYKKILSCLHPDRVIEPELKQNYEEAFLLFTVLEKRLLDEKNSPTQFVNLPKTRAEWDELKRQADERKAKGHTRHGIARR